MKIIKIVLALYFSFFTGCVQDTCNPLGKTFHTIVVEDSSINDSGQLVVSFQVSALPFLPELYFKEGGIRRSARYLDIDEPELLESYMLEKGRFEIILKSEALPIENESRPLYVEFVFPDRRGYVDCNHPGQSDQYFLRLIMEISYENSDNYVINNFNWEQVTSLGAI